SPQATTPMKLIHILSIAFVASQSNTTVSTGGENSINRCIENAKCGSDMECKARCAGVPNPTEEDIKKTNECYNGCKNTSTSNDVMLECNTKCQAIFINARNKDDDVSSSPKDTTKPGSNSTSKNSTSKTNSTSSSSYTSRPTSNVLPAASLLVASFFAFLMI
ncbi:hypothetical protein L0F63_006155, partial [Massospora cicadina]